MSDWSSQFTNPSLSAYSCQTSQTDNKTDHILITDWSCTNISCHNFAHKLIMWFNDRYYDQQLCYWSCERMFNKEQKNIEILQEIVFWDFVKPILDLKIDLFLGVPSKLIFRKTWAFGPTRGGGLTEAQVFVKIFQNQICLGKWPEMWWNTQYINGGAISHQFMKFLDPSIPNYSLSQPKKMKFFMKNNMLRIA